MNLEKAIKQGVNVSVDPKILQNILAENKAYKQDISYLVKIIKGFMDVMGLMDENNKVITEHFLPENDPKHKPVMPVLIKATGDIVSLMIQAQVPVIGRKAAEKMQKKFCFLGDIKQYVLKYSL